MSSAEMITPVGGTFLASLTEGECDALHGIGVLRSHQRGDVLMLQGDTDDRVMILLDGRVKVARLEQDGRELMLDIRDPGDLLGELAFIDGGGRVATVTALEPVQALVTPAEAFRHHLETTPRVAVVLLEIVARRFRASSVKRSQFAVADTMGRLAARLLELARRYGEPSEEGIRLTSPLSQEDLAAWTGASRAGVAEALRVMRDLGWLETERMKILVRDVDALRARAG
jgi:CRP/FNR family transcriptional regulator, cyclic AMP receptor protein